MPYIVKSSLDSHNVPASDINKMIKEKAKYLDKKQKELDKKEKDLDAREKEIELKELSEKDNELKRIKISNLKKEENKDE